MLCLNLNRTEGYITQRKAISKYVTSQKNDISAYSLVTNLTESQQFIIAATYGHH